MEILNRNILRTENIICNQIVNQKEFRKFHKEDNEIRKLCELLLKNLSDLKEKHGKPHHNFNEVRNKVLKEYVNAKEELESKRLYPELVYKFYYISTLFEVLTVYDLDKQIKNQYLLQGQLKSPKSIRFCFGNQKSIKRNTWKDLFLIQFVYKSLF